MFGVSRLLPFVADAISYAISFVSLLFVRPAFQETREPTQTRLRTEIAEGMRWLWSQPFLRTTVLLVAGTNFVHQGLFGIVLIVRAKELGASPSLIGGMLAFSGAAAILGFNVVVGSYRYALVPDRLLGRVQSAGLVLAWGAIPLGALFAGFAVDAMGTRSTLLVLAGILLALALAGSASTAVRRAPRPEELLATGPARDP